MTALSDFIASWKADAFPVPPEMVRLFDLAEQVRAGLVPPTVLPQALQALDEVDPGFRYVSEELNVPAS